MKKVVNTAKGGVEGRNSLNMPYRLNCRLSNAEMSYDLSYLNVILYMFFHRTVIT